MVKFIPEARRAWRMLSVQAMTAAGAVQVAWTSLPEDMKSSIPPRLVTYLTLALLVLGVAGRLIKQPAVSE